MVKVLPVLVVSPQPTECDFSVALVAEPLEFSVKLTTVLPTPQPPCPYSVTCHAPARSALTTLPVAELCVGNMTMTANESTANNAARDGRRRCECLWF